MFKTNFFKYTCYTLISIAVSEIFYLTYVSKKNKKKNINEVIFVNSLTQMCYGKHKTKNDVCKNKYCYIKNINSLCEYIDNAKYTIDLCMYIFSANELADALESAHKKGIKIRIICDEGMVNNSKSQVTKLNNLEIPLRFERGSAGLMHHKFCIIDGPKAICYQILQKNLKNFKWPEFNTPLLLNGSMNWTTQGLNTNWENIVITSNSELIKKFEEEFQRLWIELRQFSP